MNNRLRELQDKMERYWNQVEDAVKWLNILNLPTPKIGVVLGSGLGPLAGLLKKGSHTVKTYGQIPHFFVPSNKNHAGELIFGKINEVDVVGLSGRIHMYEGYSAEEVAFHVRVLAKLGIKALITTHAAGSVNVNFEPTNLMIINDHINLTGESPLEGMNNDGAGPEFLGMNEVYNREFIRIMEQAGEGIPGLRIHKGTVAMLKGRQYETPAEIRMLRILGADSTGMSIIPETTAMHHMGVKVCAISCISNYGAGMSPDQPNDKEVAETVARIAKEMSEWIFRAIPRIAETL